MRFIGFLGIVTFGLAVQVSAGLAAGEDVFVVPRVPVQAQADSARQAKDAAQSQGRRRAMDILLRRLTPESDWIYLPKLAAGAPADAVGGAAKSPVSLSAGDLEGLESGFEVYGEKSSSKTYRAFITYRFKPDAVRNLLKVARIPYSEAQTRTALVLPVLQTDKGVYLWEQNNPWMAAWKSRPYTHELTPMSAPLGDLEDSALVSAGQALALDADRLKAIAEHYSISQVIVAHARLRQQDGRDQLSVRLINGYRDAGDTSPVEELGSDDDVAALEQSDRQNFGVAPVQAPEFASEIGDVLGQTYLTEPTGNFPVLAERAIESAIAKYSSGWKSRTLIDHSAETVLATTAFFDSINDWSKIRAALISTPLVGAVQVSALSRRGAEMRVRVFGEPGKLQVAMENQGLVFWTETGERWFVATPSVASKFRGQRFLRGNRRRGRFGQNPESDALRPIPAAYGMDGSTIDQSN